MKIKTGDKVMITSGKDKGKTGKVLQVFPKLQKVVVEGANEATKHLKKQGNVQGQKITFSSPVHVSNVQVVGKKSTGRVGYKFLEKDGKRIKVRVLRKKGTQEDLG